MKKLLLIMALSTIATDVMCVEIVGEQRGNLLQVLDDPDYTGRAVITYRLEISPSKHILAMCNYDSINDNSSSDRFEIYAPLDENRMVEFVFPADCMQIPVQLFTAQAYFSLLQDTFYGRPRGCLVSLGDDGLEESESGGSEGDDEDPVVPKFIPQLNCFTFR